MILLGHIGITVFLAGFLYVQPSFAFLAVMLPDIADKILFFIGIAPYSRFIGHTIFFGPVASFITYVATGRKDLSLAVLLIFYLHLLEDSLYFLPLFYPLISYDFPKLEPGLRISSYEIVAEILGIFLLAATVAWYPKILKIRERVRSKIF